jgi:glutamate dehydrogenase (NAD(P)+)
LVDRSLLDPSELLSLECDVLIPAAVVAGRLRCWILAEVATGPITPDADAVLSARGDVYVLPHILCNSGGVIVS